MFGGYLLKLNHILNSESNAFALFEFLKLFIKR